MWKAWKKKKWKKWLASKNNTNKCNDNRAEHEATFSCKTYEMKDGSKKQEWHYGFRAHIICDAKYGLPIKSKVTPANSSEQTELDNLLKEMQNNDKEQYKLEKIMMLIEKLIIFKNKLRRL